MIVSAKQMIQKAAAGHYAVGMFNINNMEWAQAALSAAQELDSPIILGLGPKGVSYMGGFGTAVALVNALLEEMKISVPVALHLDHGSFEAAKACIRAGFSSIMYDGSHEPFQTNLERTRQLCFTCELLGISLEAEVGAIGGAEEGIVGKGELADPEECRQMAQLPITMLAAGIGNIHGKYPANWPGLHFDTLTQIKNAVGELPLVLHGGSGIPDEMVRHAIDLGVAKVNVNTECMLAFQQALHTYFASKNDAAAFAPWDILSPARDAIKNTVMEKIRLFGSVGKAG